MNYGSDAADQIVRMSLNGVEVAAKLTGKAAERLAILLYAVLRDQKKTRGKVRLTNMLKSGKELKVFAVKDGELKKFCEEAKKYGVLYCVLKDTNAEDGLTDIMVRAEDASKINRIFERFGLATIDMASVKTEIQRAKDKAKEENEIHPIHEKVKNLEERTNEFLNTVIAEEPLNKEKMQTENPTMAWTAKSPQSEPSSGNKKDQSEKDVSTKNEKDRADPTTRRSVRAELEEIKLEQMVKTEKAPEKAPDLDNIHIPVPKKLDPVKELE